MAKQYILYNPNAGCGSCQADVQEAGLGGETVDLCGISDYAAFFAGVAPEDPVILCGGDGTLHRFINDTASLQIPNPLFYYASGSGNDFAHDLGHRRHDPPDYPIGPWLRDLPAVTVKGETRRFLNGVGYGIDGYCCQEGDELRRKNEKKNRRKPINYTPIALKGLLFCFKPRNAVVTVDGVRFSYHNVWLAPTMKGRYYGGGMMMTPGQQRGEGLLSLLVLHDVGKLKLLTLFPTVYSGRHMKYTQYIALHRGREITVAFDRPTPLQIDGETVLDVTSYTVRA